MIDLNKLFTLDCHICVFFAEVLLLNVIYKNWMKSQKYGTKFY